MAFIENERPHNLMDALAAVRDRGCNMEDQACVITTLHEIAQDEVATWLEHHSDSYREIVTQEFSQWLATHSPYQGESIAQEAAKATGLEMPEDSFS